MSLLDMPTTAIDLLLKIDDRARCRDADPEAFMLEGGRTIHEARRICMACPVIDDCREYALRYERYGVWAGMSEVERQRWRTANGVILPKDDPTE